MEWQHNSRGCEWWGWDRGSQGREKTKDIKVEKKRWTKAVPAWGWLGDFQLSLDGTGLPTGAIAH